ncbi:MAG: O-methyltransferase [Myxococcota bacterium]
MNGPWEAVRWRAQSLFRSVWQTQDHGGLIRALLADLKAPVQRGLIFLETGCGLSTLALAEVAERTGAELYSCDVNAEKIAELRRRSGDALARVHFLEGDSLASLARIAARHNQIDFALLDSAPSATHTLREFQLLEPRLGAGARVLIDNAALPGARLLLSPCRKGKLLVPYLLASPFWTVTAHPRAGDSMVSAVHDRAGARADSSYEDPSYVDHWRATFDRGLQPSR